MSDFRFVAARFFQANRSRLTRDVVFRSKCLSQQVSNIPPLYIVYAHTSHAYAQDLTHACATQQVATVCAVRKLNLRSTIVSNCT